MLISLLIVTCATAFSAPWSILLLGIILGYIYLRYFSPFSTSFNGSSVTSFILPLVIVWIMIALPHYALITLFLFFPLATPIAFLYSRKRFYLIAGLVTIALTTYFVFCNPAFSSFENTLLALWLSGSFLIYGFRDRTIAKQVIHQQQEQKQLQAVTQNLAKTKEALLGERQQLAAERNQLSIILSAIGDAVLAVDAHQKILFSNGQAQKLLKRSEVELIGRPIESILHLRNQTATIDASMYLPKHTSLDSPLLYKAEKAELIVPNHHVFDTMPVLHSKKIFVNLTTARIVEARSQGVDAIITIHDVTKEKELEDLHLDLLSIAAHELKSPLTALRGYMVLLEQESNTGMSTDQKLFLNRMAVLMNQLLRLLDNLLAASKIEHETMQLHLEPVQLADLIDKVLDDMRIIAADKHLRLTYHKPRKQLPIFMADSMKLAEVLTNLLSNAIKHTPSKGNVVIKTSVENGDIACEVTDTGEGIPHDAIPTLFTKYFQVDQNRNTTHTKGTGLGLFIAKEIIAAHHGTITARS